MDLELGKMIGLLFSLKEEFHLKCMGLVIAGVEALTINEFDAHKKVVYISAWYEFILFVVKGVSKTFMVYDFGAYVNGLTAAALYS